MAEATENTENTEKIEPLSDIEIEALKEAEKETRTPSKLYTYLGNLMFFILISALALTAIAGVFTLDFLDIWTFRYKLPENWQKKWPLSVYYDFVQKNQLPEEQKYHEMMMEMQKKMNEMITQGNDDLKKRAQQLEDSYKSLVRAQKEKYDREYNNLLIKIDEYKEDRRRLDNEIASFSVKQKKNEELAQRLASETANVEMSLIRFMENQNRLDQVCSIAAQMEPKALAAIFDEMSDDQLIYDIMGGLQPQHSAKVLSGMDAEKAGKVLAIGNNPAVLPSADQVQSYVPPGLKSLLEETKANAQ